MERAIVDWFAEGVKTATIEELSWNAYHQRITRAHRVAVARALKRLQAKGYPVELERDWSYGRGRPMTILCTCGKSAKRKFVLSSQS